MLICNIAIGYRRRFFTLIELLVVIGIITILASLLLPALNKMRSSAMTSICKNNLQQISLCFNSYSLDWDGYICPGTQNAGENIAWSYTLLKEYLTSTHRTNHHSPVAYCPEVGKVVHMDVDGKGNNADSDAGAGQNDHWTNYVINGDIVIRHNYFPNLKKYSQIKKHSTTAQVFDGLASVEYWEYSVIKLNEVNPLNDPPGLWDHNKIGYVHNSKANILYLDSHVESVGRNEMPDAISSKALPSWDDDLFE